MERDTGKQGGEGKAAEGMPHKTSYSCGGQKLNAIRTFWEMV